jgi:hypothetical protein
LTKRKKKEKNNYRLHTAREAKNTKSYLFIEFTTPACGISIDRDKKKKQQNDDESLSLDRTCYYLRRLIDSFLFDGMMCEKEETQPGMEAPKNRVKGNHKNQHFEQEKRPQFVQRERERANDTR